MKLCFFSDIHRRLDFVEKIINTSADMYIAAGDLSTAGRGLERVGSAFRSLGEKLVLIPGNNESSDQVKEICETYGFVDLHGKSIEIELWTIAGIGYSTPGLGFPGEMTEEQFSNMLQPFLEIKGKMILVAHSPAAGTVQESPQKGLKLGSKAIREFIDTRQPEFFFSGHIHQREGYRDQIGKTQCIGLGPDPHLLEL